MQSFCNCHQIAIGRVQLHESEMDDILQQELSVLGSQSFNP
jgi:hypothetical protein